MTRTRIAIAVLTILLLASPLLAAEKAAEHGRLFEVDGVRVLRLWGTPHERGVAHGTLVGREIVDVVNSFLKGPWAQMYVKKVLPLVPFAFRWPDHVLEEKRIRPLGSNTFRDVDVRFVCATNRNLTKEVAEGRFLEDLYYRLNVINIDLPPLRERV